MPKVSVVIPTYNHEQFIGQALESVFSQTFRDFELIVVNDGSPDDTEEVLRPHIESGKIQYIRQENQGVAAARNRGAAEARGEYLAFLDDDDCWPPDKLEWQVAIMESSDIVMVAGRNDSERLPATDKSLSKEPYLLLKTAALFRQNTIGSPGQTLIRRVAFDAVGGFDHNIWGVDDYDLWIRLSHEGQIQKHSKLALFYRFHDTNASLDHARMASNLIKVIGKNSGIVGVSQKLKFEKLGYRYHFNYFGKKMTWKAGAQLFSGEFSNASDSFIKGMKTYRGRMLKDPVLFGMVILTVLKIPIRARRYL
jgi:glycosyltransferase involved in cell wall biosynthesis